jgi:hypothetical protein
LQNCPKETRIKGSIPSIAPITDWRRWNEIATTSQGSAEWLPNLIRVHTQPQLFIIDKFDGGIEIEKRLTPAWLYGRLSR